MGQGLSTEIGEGSLFYDNLRDLEAVKEKLKENDASLENADLSNRYIGDEGIVAASEFLKHNTTIERLNLSYDRLTDASIALLSQVMSENKSIEVLNLSGNVITSQGASFLSALLKQNRTMHSLVLFNCQLDDKCALQLAQALEDNNSLHTLNLGMNCCTADAVDGFLRCLEKNRALGVIDLRRNDGIDELMRRKIAEALEKQKEESEKLQAERKERIRDMRQSTKRAATQEMHNASPDDPQEAEAPDNTAGQDGDLEERQRDLEAEEEELRLQQRNAAQERRENKELAKSMREAYLQTAIDNAYKWRDKLHSGVQRGWQSGFTVQPRSCTGDSNLDSYGIVRRLQPCWCEPTDAPAGYAGQLHYHCKYEQEPEAFQAGSDEAPKYEGCKRTGHPCVSVGVYAKPLQKDTAATFFSSRSPHQVPDTM